VGLVEGDTRKMSLKEGQASRLGPKEGCGLLDCKNSPEEGQPTVWPSFGQRGNFLAVFWATANLLFPRKGQRFFKNFLKIF